MSVGRLFGLGVAACVACCAGPLLVAVGGIAALGAAGYLVLGTVSIVAAGLTICAVLLVGRRRRAPDPDTSAERVPLGPTRR